MVPAVRRKRMFLSASLVHLASMYPAFDWSLGRCIASAIASESRMSFFCPFEYGRTYCAGISRAWWPNPCSLRLRWCAPTSASIPMRQGRMLANRASAWLRDHFCRSTMAPRSSWPTMWNEFLPISIPTNGDCSVECLGHGVLLVFGASYQLRSLAGQEHGRTIPLADISGVVGLPTGFDANRPFFVGRDIGQARSKADDRVLSPD